MPVYFRCFFFSSRRRHTRAKRDWSSDVCSSDLAGDREARRELPKFDTGHWARYSLSGEISDTSYMVLLRDFLRGLCDRVGPSPYCTYAAKFTRYLGG